MEENHIQKINADNDCFSQVSDVISLFVKVCIYLEQTSRNMYKVSIVLNTIKVKGKCKHK